MTNLTGNGPTPDRGRGIPVEPTETERRGLPAAIKRISWGAIIAGAFIALVVQLGLGLLGLAIGLGAIDPATEANPLSGIGIGTGIWLAISTLLALFAGGFVAARMAGLPRRPDGILHGIVAWSLVTVLTFYLMTTAVGRVISGAAGVVGQGLDLLGQGVTAVGSQVAQSVDIPEGTLQEIKDEAAQLLRQTDVPALQPDSLQEQAQAAANQAQNAASDAARTPSDARQDLDSALDRLLNRAQGVVNAADREAVVNVLMERSDMSRAEAERTVDQYIERAQQASEQLQQQAGQMAEQAQETAVQATDAVAAALSSAALWAFVAMVIGALAAAFGGATGTPHDLPATPAVRRE
ncbi:MAG: hypothetical protein ACR2GR_04110 [Rhodothermales bacterium]